MFLPHARRWPGIALGVAVLMIAAQGWHGDVLRESVRAPQLAKVTPVVGRHTPAPLDGRAPGARNGRPWEDVPGWDAMTPRERITTLLAKPFCLPNHGRLERLELALDALFVPKGPGGAGFKTFPPRANAEALLRQAEQMQQETGILPELVLYLAEQERTGQSRRILTDELLLRADAPEAVVGAATAAGCEAAHAVQGVAGYVVARDERMPGSTLLAAADLSRVAGISSARPMVAGGLKTMFTPNDPYFKNQWHLKNTHQVWGVAGVDANVTPVWDSYQGSGVVIGVLDTDLQTEHPDLSANFLPASSYDFLDGGQQSPDPQLWDVDSGHGTCVAGLAGASGNNGVGVSGVAPQASLAGIRMVGYGTSDATEVQALGYANDVIAIKNCSWGLPIYLPSQLGILSDDDVNALASAVTQGRGGKGVILTFAAGNDYQQLGLQSSKAGFPGSIYVCAVGAVNSSGVRSYFSEFGAHLLTCSPSSGGSLDPGMWTTDLMDSNGINSGTGEPYGDGNYTSGFTGTSAATAVVSGVVALMLQANPELGWRDVKEILLRSGTKLAPTDPDWVSRSGGTAALPAIKHNHQYGGGMINAVNAVNLAKSWINLAPMPASPISESFAGSQAIPDYSATDTTVSLDFTGDTPTRVEQVEVTVNMQHQFRGDVSIDLVSPAGTVSHLVAVSSQDSDPGGYSNYTFSSARHWGESSLGVWKVIFRDMVRGNIGSVTGVTINLWGVPCAPVQITQPPQDQVVGIGGGASFSVAAAGPLDLSCQWSKNAIKITGGTAATYELAKVTTASAGAYSVQVSNLTGRQTATASLGVVDTTPHPVTLNQGGTLVLQATAAGPGIQYLWNKNGTSLTDDPAGRITGTGTAKLTVKNIATSDADVYTCTVTVGTAALSTGDYTVTVRVKPQIADGFQFTTASVSAGLVIPVPVNVPGTGIDGYPTKFTISGLPSGLTYNSLAGVITGTPNVSGSFTITITVSNAAGSGVTVKQTLVVQPLAATAVGTFNGLVAPNTTGNGNLGGTISVVTQPTGTLTGRLTMGATAYALTGRLNATLSAAPTATLAISRGAKLLPLRVLFSIDTGNGHLTGTVDDTTPTFTTTLEAWQNPYGVLKAGAIATTYNAWIDPPVDSTLPQGASYGTLVVNTVGTATWSGTLADGTAVTRTTTIGPYGDVPLQFMLYASTGSFQGWLNAAVPDSGANTLTGTMGWLKNPQPGASTTRSYKSGFSIPALTVTGGQYVKPASDTILWGLPNAADNAALAFTDGGISSAADAQDLMLKTFSLLPASTVQLPQPNPTVLTLAVNATTGRFAGSAVLKDATPGIVSRPLAFSGIIVSSQAKGRGFFTLSQLPNTATSPILSGAVDLSSAVGGGGAGQ